jgi:hypothetical protein
MFLGFNALSRAEVPFMCGALKGVGCSLNFYFLKKIYTLICNEFPFQKSLLKNGYIEAPKKALRNFKRSIWAKCGR